MKTFDNISKYIKLLRKYNKLELEYEELKEYTQKHCFDMLLDKLGEPNEIKRLKAENKRLRIKLKELKKHFNK